MLLSIGNMLVVVYCIVRYIHAGIQQGTFDPLVLGDESMLIALSGWAAFLLVEWRKALRELESGGYNKIVRLKDVD